MYAENERLVYRVYHDLGRSASVAAYAEDIIQDGRLALCRAIIAYDPARCVPFASFAYNVIHNAMLTACKQITGKTLWGLDSLADISDDSKICADVQRDIFADVTAICDNTGKKSLIIGIRAIILSVQGYTTAEIGKLLHYSSASIRTYQTTARHFLREDPDAQMLLGGI